MAEDGADENSEEDVKKHAFDISSKSASGTMVEYNIVHCISFQNLSFIISMKYSSDCVCMPT